MYFVLTANNNDTNIGIAAVAANKEGAFDAMYDRFAAILGELFPSVDIPAAEAARESWEFRSTESGYEVGITEDGYSIDYGGGDLAYCSIVEHHAPACTEEGIVKTLRILSSGRCCSVCKQHDSCLDTEEVTVCSAFSPNEKFLSLLMHDM